MMAGKQPLSVVSMGMGAKDEVDWGRIWVLARWVIDQRLKIRQSTIIEDTIGADLQ
jgi:hypothetical protein